MKRGFTLAEVLITLGIIGVVAAMTMPSLIANYQKKVLVTQLKKEINYIQNNIHKILADEEVDSLKDTDYLDEFGHHLDNDKFVKYLNLEKINFKLEGEDAQMYSNSSGACLTVSNTYSNLFSTITLDVNCLHAPNKYGRDIFMIFIDDKGDLIDSGDAIGAPIDFLNENICNKNLSALSAFGSFCVYKIIHDGWEMNY